MLFRHFRFLQVDWDNCEYYKMNWKNDNEEELSSKSYFL